MDHVADKDTHIDKYIIPKGTTVQGIPRTLMFDQKVKFHNIIYNKFF